MKIGIDIDDTLSCIKNKVNKELYNYCIKIGKNVKLYKGQINSYDYLYKEVYKLNDREKHFFCSTILENIMSNIEPRRHVVKVLKRLKKENYEIYIITSRSTKYHKDPYILSKKWLDKYEILYDKLIVNVNDKLEICKSYKIDIFIDDQICNCEKILKNNMELINKHS